MTVKASTPTGMTRGLSVNREPLMGRIALTIGNEVERSPSRVYAQVNLSDDAARKLRDELNALLGEGGEA